MSPPTDRKYAEAKTCVVWDVTDCPNPTGLDPGSIYRNIKSALAKKGYLGEVTVTPYCETNQFPNGPDDFESAGMQLIPAGDKRMRLRKMVQEFLRWVLSNNQFSNFMVISRNGMELAMALESLKMNGHNIFFANPEQHGPRICECNCETRSYDLATEIWVWETLAAGGDPLAKTKRDAEVSNEEDDDVMDSDSQD